MGYEGEDDTLHTLTQKSWSDVKSTYAPSMTSHDDIMD